MRRVAVTTTPDRAPKVSEMLAARGLEPVILPCIEVVAAPDEVLEGARAASREADWIVLTSARAVEVTWPQGGMPEVPVAAVGPTTAKAVEGAEGQVEMIGVAGAADLTAELAPAVRDETVVFPHAAGADPSTVKRLEQAGARVLAFEVYRTQPIPPGADPVDAVIFGSPSAVTGWLGSRDLDDLVVAVIGETTRLTLAELGHEADVVPDHPDLGSLVALLEEYLSERSPA